MSKIIEPNGPGKYDDVCSYVRKKTAARGVIVMVFAGNKGGGFSVQAELDVLLTLPKSLRFMADDIEKQNKGLVD